MIELYTSRYESIDEVRSQKSEIKRKKSRVNEYSRRQSSDMINISENRKKKK